MELTSQTLKDAQFRQAWKGYDTAEVDDFLDDLAVGVDVIAGRLKDALERLAEAESRAVRAESRPAAKPQADESVRRTLVLAQRAADLVVTEAKSVADRVVADAHAQAASIIAAANSSAGSVHQEATTKAAAVIAEAEATAQRMTAQRAAELQQELSGLIEEQARRRLDLEQLSSHAESTYEQLRGQLQAQLAHLEALRIDPAGHRRVDQPDTTTAPRPLPLSLFVAPMAPMAPMAEESLAERAVVEAPVIEAVLAEAALADPALIAEALAEALADASLADESPADEIVAAGALVDDALVDDARGDDALVDDALVDDARGDDARGDETVDADPTDVVQPVGSDGRTSDDDQRVITLGGPLVDDRDLYDLPRATIPSVTVGGEPSSAERDPASMFLDLADAIGSGRGSNGTAAPHAPNGPVAEGSVVVADPRLSAMALALLNDRSTSDTASRARSSATGAD